MKGKTNDRLTEVDEGYFARCEAVVGAIVGNPYPVASKEHRGD